MKAYSQDFRERVVGAWDEGRGTRPQIAGWFGVSTAWIRRLLQRRRDTGSLAVQPHAGGSAPKLDLDHELRLTALVTAQPDATLVELRQRLGLSVHRSTVARALLRLGWRVKKSPAGGRAGPCRRPPETGVVADPGGAHRPEPLGVPR